jgi:dUTP pyrophosphatase
MFEILDEVCTPARATQYSAYVDLCSKEEMVIGPGETKIVPLGVIIDLDKLKEELSFNYGTKSEAAEESMFKTFMSSNYLEVAIRSSLSAKYGLVIANGSGKVDLDYPKELGVIIHNPIKYSDKNSLEPNFLIKKGDRVAQCTLIPHNGWAMGYETEEKRTGGFGSTGK